MDDQQAQTPGIEAAANAPTPPVEGTPANADVPAQQTEAPATPAQPDTQAAANTQEETPEDNFARLYHELMDKTGYQIEVTPVLTKQENGTFAVAISTAIVKKG